MVPVEVLRDSKQEDGAGSPPPIQSLLGPLTPTQRADMAQQIRVDAADFQRSVPLPAHTDNGDEANYTDRRGNFTKGLPHQNDGRVDTSAYNA